MEAMGAMGEDSKITSEQVKRALESPAPLEFWYATRKYSCIVRPYRPPMGAPDRTPVRCWYTDGLPLFPAKDSDAENPADLIQRVADKVWERYETHL